MTQRRYTDEETAAIFQQAAEGPAALSPPGPRQEGLSLAELQEIGREVGIAPEAIARAAKSLDQVPERRSQRFLGIPVGVGRTVTLARPLSDEEWDHLVVELRRVFSARGNVRTQGSLREWTNGNLQVLLEPAGDGRQRLVLQTVKGNARVRLMAGVGMLGAAGAVVIAGASAGQGAGSLSGTAVLWILGFLLFGGTAFRLPGWARRRQHQMDAIARQLVQVTGQPPEGGEAGSP